MTRFRSVVMLCALIALIARTSGMEPLQAEAAAAYGGEHEAPRFNTSLSYLKFQIADVMGEPVECAHIDQVTGDTLQQTTTGLAYVRKWTGLPTFTDGWNRWTITANGLVSWQGPDLD